ncbi:MAG: alpha/beta fold hydrolase [Paenisporosarcina sp.]
MHKIEKRATVEKEKFVQVGSIKLYTKMFGKKNNFPTIVMDAGYGDYSKAWDSLIHEVARISQVLVFDRAGLGKSEKSQNARISSVMIKEMDELLTGMGIEPPYILVGHSFGGVNARMYATEFTDKVVGLILVDSTPEEYKERFLPTMPIEFQEAYTKQFTLEGTFDEFKESLVELKQTRSQLNIPLIVLSAGKKDHYTQNSQELWNEMQKELLEISTKSEFMIAKNSAHYIQNDEPGIILDAIKRLNKLI